MASLAIGAVIAVGSYLLGGSQSQKNKVEGARLGSSNLTTSTEGGGVTTLFGRQRLDGQIIWATQFTETVNTATTTTKAGGKGGAKQVTETTEYTYTISLAIAFCKGNSKATVSRMWADGKELDISLLTYRFYPGSDTQTADPKIEATQGAGNVPAYRGIAYIVIEDMELAKFGNRVPQITAEIVIPTDTDDPIDIQNSGEAYALIPTAGETIYSPSQIDVRTGGSFNNYTTKPDNIHNAFREPDVVRSIADLTRMQTNLDAVLIAVSWFGDDLRAGECTVRPRIEDSGRVLTPAWTVGSYNRSNTAEVSRDADGRPVFGGTPSDQSIVELIQYLKAQGKRVIFYPSIIMDIGDDNTLPNPYSDDAADLGQPAFPWRGRITCSPAPGYTGAVDKTGAAATQVDNFFNDYDAMVDHYAALCATAGGVDGFVIGSELVGLTTSRSALGVYPSVTRLVSLAASVKAVVGGATDVTYAADWSEWVHSQTDGYWFHLDPLWASVSIDVCSVNNYLPMSDWRDGTQHLDYDGINGPVSPYEPSYLAGQIEGGEYYDYFYASQTDRDSQIRTPITDVLGKDWMRRRKDFRGWWSNTHYNRPSWVEDGSPTAWTAHSKPIWFTGFGVPAVDKGTNQPDALYDPKSSESLFPHYSSGLRDDFIQRVAVETTLDYWRNNSPESGGLKMIEPRNMFIWAWDARPFPDYPVRSDVWTDGALWFFGHWWTGRIESVPLPQLVAALCRIAGLTGDQFDVTGLYGPGALVRGFQIDRPEPIRRSIETLMQAFLFDGFESEGRIKFILRSNTKTSSISGEDFVVSDRDPVGVTLKRGQETDLPSSVKITFVDEFNDYNSATVDGKTSRGYSQNIEELDLPVTLTTDYVRGLADGTVQQKWIERQTGGMSLPPSLTKLDPGDAITFPVGGFSLTGRLTVLSLGAQRDGEFTAFDPGIFSLPASPADERLPAVANIFGAASLVFLDLPLFIGDELYPWAPRLAAYANPWPGGVNVYRQSPDTTYKFNTAHNFRNAVGTLNAPLTSGPTGVWDRANTIDVTFDYGALSSVSELQAMEGAIALGVYNAVENEWEVVQFATATLTGARTYAVTDLLRGQLGTEKAMGAPDIPIGAAVVLLEPAFLSVLNVTDDLVAETQTYSWGPSRYPQSDYTYQSAEFAGKRVGLRPYSPASAKLSVNGTNDLAISWVRRTRFGGDGWTVTEPPLNEEVEQYRVRIYNGGTVVREEIVTTPEYTYSAINQAADFGSAQTTLTLDIAQYGAAYGGYGTVRDGTYAIKRATV
jgi:hypothetical protein